MRHPPRPPHRPPPLFPLAQDWKASRRNWSPRVCKRSHEGSERGEVDQGLAEGRSRGDPLLSPTHLCPAPASPLHHRLCSPATQLHSLLTRELRLLHLRVHQLGQGQSTRGGHHRGSDQGGGIDLQGREWGAGERARRGPGVQPRAAGAHWVGPTGMSSSTALLTS